MGSYHYYCTSCIFLICKSNIFLFTDGGDRQNESVVDVELDRSEIVIGQSNINDEDGGDSHKLLEPTKANENIAKQKSEDLELKNGSDAVMFHIQNGQQQDIAASESYT